MISVTKFVICIDENANGVGAEVANIDQAFEYAQSVSKENGDNDDDVIYDYAPAAWMDHMHEPWFCTSYILVITP